MPRPRQWSATATATSAVEDRCSRIYRAIPTTAPPGVTAVRASWSRWPPGPAASVSAHRALPRRRGSARAASPVPAPRPTRRSPRRPRWPAAGTRRQSHRAGSPGPHLTRRHPGPAILATAGSISVIIAHPLILRGASAAFTVAPRAAPAQGDTSRPVRTLAGARSPASSHVASRKPTLSSATSPGCDSLKTSPRARPDRASHARQGPRAPGQPVLANPVPPENSASVIEMAIELPDRYGPDALSAGVGPVPDPRHWVPAINDDQQCFVIPM